MNKRLVIVGAGGHGEVAADIAELMEYCEIIFYDDNLSTRDCLGHPVIGRICDIIPSDSTDYFVAIGNHAVRKTVTTALHRSGITPVTLIHPSAVIAVSVSLGEGSIVMAGAVINPKVNIGCSCIINTGATVDHDSVIGDYCHISVGSHLAGNVSIGANTWVGAGAIISNNISVCADCLIGAGAVVIHNAETPGKYLGIPAIRSDSNASTNHTHLSDTKRDARACGET